MSKEKDSNADTIEVIDILIRGFGTIMGQLKALKEKKKKGK